MKFVMNMRFKEYLAKKTQTHVTLLIHFTVFKTVSSFSLKHSFHILLLTDPWPLECLAEKNTRISSEKPEHWLTINIGLEATITISESCLLYYNWETIRNLQNWTSELQQLCTDFGNPHIKILLLFEADNIENRVQI